MRVINLFNKYRLEVTNFFVGAVVLSFELAAARVVAPYIGTTIYTWTSVIGVILASLALGYGLGGFYADKRRKTQDVVLLICAAAAAILLVDLTKDWLLAHISQSGTSLRWQSLVASLLLFSVPTFLLGAVSPYLARLNITKLSSSGFSLARINAAGTVGSLFGTFITGYVLFGYIGTRNILAFLAIVLVLTTFVLEAKAYWLLRISLVIAALLCLLYGPKLKIAGLKTDTDTHYSRVAVSDYLYRGRPVRVLRTDNLSWQSGVFLDGSKDLVFSYTRAFSYIADSKPGAQNYLIIGGGAFTVPQYLADAKPSARVDTVEIDSDLPQISSEYFGFTQPANLNIITADGRQFLNNTGQKYDVVFLDAFSATTPPFQLLTKEAAARVESLLKPGGIVAVNTISPASGPNSKMAGAVYATYKSVFSNVAMFQLDTSLLKDHNQNLLLVASNNPGMVSTLQKSAASEEAKRIFGSVLDNNFAYQRILTDDFAPVEQLSTAGI